MRRGRGRRIIAGLAAKPALAIPEGTMSWDERLRELDLCILAYQLHSQSLIWPTDPYYEQLLKEKLLKTLATPLPDDEITTDKGRRRQEFIAEVRRTFVHARTGTVQPPNANADYRGPGACMGWAETNSTLDPIISEYERINPWRPCFVRPFRHKEPWLVYNAPSAITDRIGRVVVARWRRSPSAGPYDANANPTTDIVLDELTGQQPRLNPPQQNAQDWLYCFEGGTGADPSKATSRYVAWGLMGFVLASHRAAAQPPQYDVHIVFRGSRSGKLRPGEARIGKGGNPDWVTDLQILSVKTEPVISQPGKVATGFAESVKQTLPTIMQCLDDIHTRKNGAPSRIVVAGHSLGGALAGDFASAVTLGNSYGYTNAQGKMPANVRSWPWGNMTVTTFGAPAMGNMKFREEFDVSVGCKRIWVLADPITTVNPVGHLGTDIRLVPPLSDHLSPGQRHDPETIRTYVAKRYQKLAHPNYLAPATTNPTTDANRPWAYFSNCSAMLANLTTRPGYATADVFKDFIPNLVTYFQILGQVLSGGSRSQAAQKAAADLVEIVKALNKNQQQPTYADLETAWKGAKDLLAYSPKLHRYVGLCLYLAARSVGLQPPAQPKPEDLAAVVNTQ